MNAGDAIEIRSTATRPRAGRSSKPRRNACATPPASSRRPKAPMAHHVRAMLAFHAQGIPTVDYGNNLRRPQMGSTKASPTRSPFPASCRVHPAALLPRHRTLPLGRAFGRSRRHRKDRRRGQGALSGKRAAASLARHGRRAHRFPGPAGADLLARPRRTRVRRLLKVQRHGRERRTLRAESSSAAITSTRDRSRVRIEKPKRWPDGSDAVSDWPLLNALAQHRERRDLGEAYTTAAASGWGTRSMPASSSSATAARTPARRIERVLSQRSRHRRDAARRRRLPDRDRVRARKRPRPADARR